MKIAVNTPLKSDEIVNLLTNYNEGNIRFSFTGKRGMKLEFEVIGILGDAACTLAKNLIKDTDFGKILYFRVEEV